jgi:hypothetical protein
LTNDNVCCLAQIGPDGRARAVNFNKKLSEFPNKPNYEYKNGRWVFTGNDGKNTYKIWCRPPG